MRNVFSCFALILLSVGLNAQQNFFNKRYDIGGVSGRSGGVSAGIKILPNGNIYDMIAFADEFPYPHGQRMSFIRLDSLGNIDFNKIQSADYHNFFGGGRSGLNRLTDSTYLFAGAIPDTINGGDAAIYKLTKDGDSIWTKTYGDTLFQSGWTCRPTRDGGIILAGQTGVQDSVYQDDILLMKTDANGNLEWSKHYGGIDYEIGTSLDTTTDGGFVISGYTTGYGAGAGDEWGNAYVIKTDSAGNQLWSRVFGDIYDDAFWNVITCRDGSIVLCGYWTNYDGTYPTFCCSSESQLYIVKLDEAGNTLFEKKYGGSATNQLYAIKELSDGSLIAAGWYTEHNDLRGGILKINSQGDSLWLHTYKNLYGQYSFSYLWDIAQTEDGGFVACGSTVPVMPDTGAQDTWVIRIDSNGCEVFNCSFNSITELYSQSLGNDIYPNPSSGVFNFSENSVQDLEKIEVTDINGKIIFEEAGPVPYIDLGRYDPGIYFYSISGKNNRNWSGKLLKLLE